MKRLMLILTVLAIFVCVYFIQYTKEVEKYKSTEEIICKISLFAELPESIPEFICDEADMTNYVEWCTCDGIYKFPNKVFLFSEATVATALIKGLNDALEAHELIKVSVLKNCSSNIKEIAYDIASYTNSELIQVIGRNIVFYRKSKKQLIQL